MMYIFVVERFAQLLEHRYRLVHVSREGNLGQILADRVLQQLQNADFSVWIYEVWQLRSSRLVTRDWEPSEHISREELLHMIRSILLSTDSKTTSVSVVEL